MIDHSKPPWQVVNEEIASFTDGRIDFEIAREISQRVVDAHQSGGAGDPLSPESWNRAYGQIWCSLAVGFFLKHNWLLPARSLLLELWETCAALQVNTRRRVPRFLIAQLLTETTHKAGRLEEAFRWSLLSHADMALGSESPQAAKSRHWLYGIFGVTDAERTKIEDVAAACRRSVRRYGWAAPSAFAEEVLRQLSCDRTIGEALINKHALREEFPLTRTFLSLLLRDLQRARRNTDKGRRFESLASYLFLLLSGSVPRKNVLDVAGASEYDLVGFNGPDDPSGLSSRFGASYLVECKNWSRSVNVAAVGYFLHRMHLTHCRFGVILSRLGVTRRDRADAHAAALIRRSFHEDGSICVVVTLEDLNRLASGEISTVASMLVDHANRLQFGN